MRTLIAAVAIVFALGAAAKADEVKVGGDGLYHQDWFLQSFLDLREDLQESADAGKRLVIPVGAEGLPLLQGTAPGEFRRSGDPQVSPG